MFLNPSDFFTCLVALEIVRVDVVEQGARPYGYITGYLFRIEKVQNVKQTH